MIALRNYSCVFGRGTISFDPANRKVLDLRRYEGEQVLRRQSFSFCAAVDPIFQNWRA
jgi:hypothetical protein